MVQNVQSIIKRKRFVSYSKYVGHVKQAVNEINVDMVQEVTQMYDEAGKMVDASVLINNLRILTIVNFSSLWIIDGLFSWELLLRTNFSG